MKFYYLYNEKFKQERRRSVGVEPWQKQDCASIYLFSLPWYGDCSNKNPTECEGHAVCLFLQLHNIQRQLSIKKFAMCTTQWL